MRTTDDKPKTIGEIEDLKYTYDEEPTHYHQHEVNIDVTRMRSTDRFRHRQQGWATVTDVDVRVKKVRITYYLDGMDPDSTRNTYSDMLDPTGKPLMVDVIRQDETSEHELWRLEHQLVKGLDAAVAKAREAYEAENQKWADTLRKYGMRKVHPHQNYFINEQMIEFYDSLLEYMAPVQSWRRREGHKDPAAALVAFYDEQVERLLSDNYMELDDRKYRGQMLGGTRYDGIKRYVDSAKRVLVLRLSIKKEVVDAS